MSKFFATLQGPGLGLEWCTLWGQALVTLDCSR